jgi:GNAT superfamily N-acetyltransferase
MPLLYRAALQGVFGKREEYRRSSITDALFVYLDGEPEPASVARVDSNYRGRPLVCLTNAWEAMIRARYPEAKIYRRTAMQPARRFTLPESVELPEGCRLAGMDEAAYERHPFSHGKNYPSWAAFRAEGSGAVIYYGGEIVASASSFLSLSGEVEMDVSTSESHRGKKLATACVARMLRDCMRRGITVHWDAQNEVSRHLAEKFGFEIEKEYSVYWVL